MMNNSATGDSERLYLKAKDCDSIFQIPSHLLESYGVNSPSKATLRVDDSGKKWRMKIEKFKDCYFFTDGWKEFAEQVNLKSLDWLKFKPGPSKEKTRKRRGDVKATTSSIPNENKDKCSGVGTELSFTKILKKDYNRYKLCIPRKFILDTGIQIADEIKLKDGEGRVWPIVMEKCSAPTLGKGWSAFVKENKLMVGSTVSFTWLSGNMVQARIVNVGTDKQLLSTKQLQDNGSAEKILSFCRNMKKHNRNSLEMPQGFAKDIGLRKDEGIKLRNGEGREWPVTVTRRIRLGSFIMTRGWTSFVIDNKVMLGSKISFTWLSGNTLQTEISEVGTDKQPLYSAAHNKKKCL